MPQAKTQLSKEDIHSLIGNRKWIRLRKVLDDWPAAEVADILRDLEKTDRVLLFRALSRTMSAEVFGHLGTDEQEALIEAMTDHETKELLEDLPPDDRTALLEELPSEVTRQLMHLLPPEELKEARMLLGYPEESVGRLMTPDYVEIRPDWSVAQALEHIRKEGPDSETINIVYVVDKRGRLIDELKLRHIVQAHPERPISELMDERFVSLSAFQDQEDAVEKMKKYDMVALPVVDSQGVMLGIVTHDDVFDVAEEEATEDILKGASIAPLRESYKAATVNTLYRKRAPWLTLLIFVALGSTFIIASFEATLEAAFLLAAFLPLLAAMAGNTGAQSATLMVRGLATGDIELGDYLRSMGKELLVAIPLGLTLGVLAGGLGLILAIVFNGPHAIGLVVGATMVTIVIVANIVGMTMPFVLARLKVDPAVASAPLVTTLLDAIGILIYFTWAWVILHHMVGFI